MQQPRVPSRKLAMRATTPAGPRPPASSAKSMETVAGGGYAQVPMVTPASFMPLPTEAPEERQTEEENPQEKLEKVKIAKADKRIGELEEHAVFLEERLDHIDELWKVKRQELQRIQYKLAAARRWKTDHKPFCAPPPGPKVLAFLSNQYFEMACMLVVTGNLALIVLEIIGNLQHEGPVDSIFLMWYVCELLLKMMYFRRGMFLGKFGEVWINWLDVTIVFGGVGFEWVCPAIMALFGHHGPEAAEGELLGAQRLFRMLRVIKLLRRILQRDLAWTEKEWFQVAMTMLIAANSIIMALELNYEHWGFWPLIENVLLLVYVLELMAKMKFQGLSFFTGPNDLTWNYIDLVIIVGAIFDLWTFPMLQYLGPLFGREEGEASSTGGAAGSFARLLRLMRLLRILRLVKLLKKIPPLYRVLAGIMDSMKAMQWVLVLTAMVLYAMAIFWTTVVGQGTVVEDSTGQTEKNFSLVSASLFSLFLMMNGEFDRATALFKYPWGQFFVFIWMVISNWAILAVLTAVVSDNMMTSSRKFLVQDAARKDAEEDRYQDRRLRDIFGIDVDEEDADISSLEWRVVMDDHQLADELCQVANIEKAPLEDLFKQLSHPSSPMTRKSTKHDVDFARKSSKSIRHLTTERMAQSLSPEEGIRGDFRVMDHSTFLAFIQAREAPADQQAFVKLRSKVEIVEKKISSMCFDVDVDVDA